MWKQRLLMMRGRTSALGGVLDVLHHNARNLCTETHKLSQGKTISLERSFTLEDVRAFSQLCHITPPICGDLPRANHHAFPDCVVPELLYAGLFPAIIGTNFPGSIYVSQHLDFKTPVLVGDDIVAQVKAVNLRCFRNKYRVEFLTSCWKKERSILVVDGTAVALLPNLSSAAPDKAGKHETA